MKDRIKYLFLQYYYNRSTRKELDEFFHVINSAKHDQEISELVKMVYDELKQSEPSLTYVNDEGQLVLREPDWIQQHTTDKVRPIRRRYPYLVAACLSALVLGAIALWKAGDTAYSNAAIVKQFTAQAEHKYLLLPDSTQVWLNAASSIDFPEKFNPAKREVWLKGEAFFDVKHADKLPFIIHTGKVSTTVLGTAFNVRAYADQHAIVVSVKRGKVSVLNQGKVVATLTPGQEVKVSTITTAAKEQQKTMNAADVGNWQQGYLSYDDETLQEVIDDLERVYDVRIRLNNERLSHVVITTSFRRDIGAGKAMEILSALTDTRLTTDKDGFTLN